jgi:signal transduction histidine kinase
VSGAGDDMPAISQLQGPGYTHVEHRQDAHVRTNAALTPTAVRELLDYQSALLRLTVHELRRPLGLIDGYLSLIRDGSLGSSVESEELQAAILAMTAGTREMAVLVEGLAAVARQEDRATSLRLYPHCLRSVVADAVVVVSHEGKARGVHIEQDGADACANIDSNHLRVALVNLLSNAVRHSTKGSTVTVTVRAHRTAVTIAVTDKGAGVDPADIQRLFDPWYQGLEVVEGLGLGLWIVRQVAEWHGGNVTVDSVPGRGSTFSIALPASRDCR